MCTEEEQLELLEKKREADRIRQWKCRDRKFPKPSTPPPTGGPSVHSDYMRHEKTGCIFMDEILSSIPEGVDEVRVWTDGPASQFKSKFVMAATKLLSKRRGVKLIWNFSTAIDPDLDIVQNCNWSGTSCAHAQ